MSERKTYDAPSRFTPETHQRGRTKLARIPVKVESGRARIRKPSWIRVKARFDLDRNAGKLGFAALVGFRGETGRGIVRFPLAHGAVLGSVMGPG